MNRFMSLLLSVVIRTPLQGPATGRSGTSVEVPHVLNYRLFALFSGVSADIIPA
jgi:hypothetical protein